MNKDFFSALQNGQQKPAQAPGNQALKIGQGNKKPAPTGKPSEISDENIAAGWDAYKKGIISITMAESLGFKNGDLIAASMELFIHGMTLDPQNPFLPLGVAYVLSLMNEMDDAIHYVRQALQIAPDLKAAHDMLQSIIDVQKENPEDEALSALKAFDELQEDEDMDWDDFYDKVEDFIIAQVREVMQQEDALKPTHKKKRFSKNYQKWKHFVQLSKGIERQIAFLDEEFDTHEIQQRFHPFKVMLKRLKQVLDISYELQTAYQHILDGRNKTSELSDQAKKSPETTSNIMQEMEQVYDICDAVADKLDDFTSKKINIESLELEYEKMVEAIQKLQEKLDD